MPSLPARTLSTRRRRTKMPLPSVVQTVQACKHPLVALAWSPTGHYLAAAAQHGAVHLFAVQSSSNLPLRPTLVRTLCGHTADVLHLTFSPTNFLASASMDGSVRLWHPQTGACLRTIKHPDMVTDAAFHPSDPSLLLTAALDGHARLIRLADRTVLAHADARVPLTAAVFLNDGCVALGTHSGQLLRWRPHPQLFAADSLPDPVTTSLIEVRRRPSRRAIAPAAPLAATVLSGRGNPRTFASGADGRAYELRDGEVVRRMRAAGARKRGVPLGASVSTDGRFVLLDGMGGNVRVMDGRLKEQRRKDKEIAAEVTELPVSEFADVTCAAFATEGVPKRCGRDTANGASFLLAVGCDDGSIVLLEQRYKA